MALSILVVVAAYFLMHVTEVDRPEETISDDYLYAVEIIDGDTFRDSDGETVRLLGIDTPERGEAFYDIATDSLRSLLAKHPLRYELDFRKRDRYGRLLAYVFTDEAFVNHLMVAWGMAYVYIFPEDMRNLEYRGMLIEAQMDARDSDLGIWSLEMPSDAQYFVGNSESFRFYHPDCPQVHNIKPENRLIKQTQDEFYDIGYSPARNCDLN